MIKRPFQRTFIKKMYINNIHSSLSKINRGKYFPISRQLVVVVPPIARSHYRRSVYYREVKVYCFCVPSNRWDSIEPEYVNLDWGLISTFGSFHHDVAMLEGL